METGRNYFFWYRPLYEKAVERRICFNCHRWKGEREVCGTPDLQGCALFRYLPQFVMLHQRLEKPTLDSYIQAIRSTVEMKCCNPEPDKPCQLRDTLECGLVEYLPLVMEAIEEVEACLRGGGCHEEVYKGGQWS